MGVKIRRFGPDDEHHDPELAKMEAQAGSSKELDAVDLMSMDRIRSALALWLAGAQPNDIAVQLKFDSPAQARMAIERALSDSVDDTEDRAKMRLKMSLTLDRLLRSVMPKALNADNPEQLAAVRATMTIVDRKIRLHGLDAPIEHEVRMPGSEEFSMLISAAARGLGLQLPEEGDPFGDIEDAEVIDDEDS